MVSQASLRDRNQQVELDVASVKVNMDTLLVVIMSATGEGAASKLATPIVSFGASGGACGPWHSGTGAFQ